VARRMASNDLLIVSSLPASAAVPAAPAAAAAVKSGRSVADFSNLEDLLDALLVLDDDPDAAASSTSSSSRCVVGDDGGPPQEQQQGDETAQPTSSLSKSDWWLPISDPDAEEQTVEGELMRLWALKSYLLLDKDGDGADDRGTLFGALVEEARAEFGVPTALVSLVDLGRQVFFGDKNDDSRAAAATPPSPCGETPRSTAFCAHAILSKSGICIVPDAREDGRFKENRLVTRAPFLRFYAGAPLVSPEGYKLGTFCVEGPEPRPGGLSAHEQDRLRNYAARAMDAMVQRRKILQERLEAPVQECLRRHAAVTTNLGRLLYTCGECVAAMRFFQESVQTLMFLNDDVPIPGKAGTGAACSSAKADETASNLPSCERQLETAQILWLLSCSSTPENREVLIEKAKVLVGGKEEPVSPPASTTRLSTAATEARIRNSSSRAALAHDCIGRDSQLAERRSCLADIPGLFGTTSRLKGSLGQKHPPTLVFPEAFQISMKDSEDGSKVDFRNFIIPLEQCSKATLFNMGLIHYRWGSADTAMQFFDLAASLSQANTPLAFDPVVLGCLNNMAQINLQYSKPGDAMALLSDALARGNAALATMYSSSDVVSDGEISCPDHKSRRLRRKLARTMMNCGHVHFFNCEYESSMATCVDAIRILHKTNFEDEEAVAAWYNMGVLYHNMGNRMESIKYLNKFIDRVTQLCGRSHQVADALHRKGQLLFEMGNLYECMKPLNEALGIRREKCGNRHHDVADTLCLIGKVLQAREEYDFALNAFQEGLSIMKSHATADGVSLEAAQTMLELGRAYHVQGNREEALKMYTEVADVTRRFFGDRHPYVARILNIIATLHLEAGDVDESVKLFEEAMKIFVEQGVPIDMSVVNDPLLGCQLPNGDSVAPIA